MFFFLFFFSFSYMGNFQEAERHIHKNHHKAENVYRDEIEWLNGTVDVIFFLLIYMFFRKSYAAQFQMFAAFTLLFPSSAWLVLPRKFFCHIAFLLVRIFSSPLRVCVYLLNIPPFIAIQLWHISMNFRFR